MKTGRLGLVFGLTLLVACEGVIRWGASPQPSGRQPEPPTGQPAEEKETGAVVCDERVSPVAAAPMRRLSQREYRTSLVVAGVGGSNVAALQLPADEESRGVVANVNTTVSRRDVEAYLDASEQVVSALNVGSVFGCDVAVRSCIEAAIGRLSKKIVRRPLSAEERSDLLGLWEARQATPTRGAQVLLQALLNVPSFLYRVELGEGTDEVRPLSVYEFATRLSFLTTAGPPDDVLLEAAEAGKLSTPEGLLAEVRRLVTSADADRVYDAFYGQLTGTAKLEAAEKDSVLFPGFTPEVRRVLSDETRQFFRAIHRKSEPFEALLTSRRAFVSAPTAFLSNLSNNAARSVEVQFPPTGRQGFLQLPGVLAMTGHSADHLSPVYQGKFVVEALLCLRLPAPPNDANLTLPNAGPDMTIRERYDALLTGQCGACHQLFQKTGYGFLEFNAVGQSVTQDKGKPIDARGELVSAFDLTGPFQGASELSTRLAGSRRVQECFAQNWIRFAYARDVTNGDACTVKAMVDEMSTKKDINTLIEHLATSESFRLMRAQP
jgi:hypothetical protein